MREKYLPIGTVVLLNEATKRLMITGYCSGKPDDPNKVYDYVGMLFPEGTLAGDDVALFDHEQIANVAHMGLDDDEFKTLEKTIKEALLAETNASVLPVNQTADITPLGSLNPQEVSNVLEQMNSQGDLSNQLKEPTAFNEEITKKPVFELPSLDGPSTSINTLKKDDTTVVESNDKPLVEEPVKEQSVATGQPVLQLQPVFGDGVIPSGDSSPSTPSAADIPGLFRL